MRTVRLSHSIAAMAMTAFFLTAAAAPPPASAQEIHAFNILPSDPASAITALGVQAGIHILAAAKDLQGKKLNAVSGTVSTDQALMEMLDGSGLQYRYVGVRAVALTAEPGVAGPRPAAEAQGPAPAAAPASVEPTESAELSEVQITGSRIVREGYTTPTPVTAVTVQELQDAARPNVGDTLADLPVFQGSVKNSANTTGITQTGQTELNLRNLGANRTLILFDGRRLPSSNTEAVPNIALVPDALIQRVDVVTGGASAVYGSDAVSGVVNFILDTNFTGVKGSIQGGVSGYGDGPSEKVQLTGGTTAFGGRLHLVASVSQNYQAQISGTDRPWNVTGVAAIQNPAYTAGGGAPQFLAEPCCVGTTYPAGGLILAGPLQGTAFGAGGSVQQYDYGFGKKDAGSLQYGGTWQSTMAGAGSISIGETAQHFFGRAGFDITDNTEAFVEYIGANSHIQQRCCYAYYQLGVAGANLYTSNPYIPASVLAQAQALNVTTFKLGQTLRYPTDQFQDGGVGANNFRDTNIYVAGLKGKFDALKTSWTWNAYAQQGISIEDFHVPEPITPNLTAAIQAVRVGTYGPGYTAAAYPNPRNIAAGTITCSSNLLPLSNANATSDCVPYNLFGTNVASQAAIDYVNGTALLRQVDTQTIAGASISGDPFNNWAGPVSLALSGEWRHEIADGTSDPISAASNYWSVNFHPVVGSQSVAEGAVETVFPLLKDKPFAEALDFNGGARVTKYSTSGRVQTWKLGLEWTPIDDIRFRGTWSMDIRAPNLNDLFGRNTGHGTVVDPFFGNVSAPAFTNTFGNANLKPETAHQAELGFVLQPSFISGLHFSADWYRIKVDGAITVLSNTFELQDCFTSRIGTSYTGTSPYCSLISRNADNSLNAVTVAPFNVASLLAEGIDYALDYRTRLDRFSDSLPGTVGLSLSLTQTQKLITDTGIPGPTRVLDGAGFANSPKMAGMASLTYELDPIRFVVEERYIGAVRSSNLYIQCAANCPTAIPSGFQTVNYDPRIGSYFLTDVSAQYKFWSGDGGKNALLFVSVDNLLNRNPPWNKLAADSLFHTNTNGTLYDQVGLYARAGVRFRF